MAEKLKFSISEHFAFKLSLKFLIFSYWHKLNITHIKSEILWQNNAFQNIGYQLTHCSKEILALAQNCLKQKKLVHWQWIFRKVIGSL